MSSVSSQGHCIIVSGKWHRGADAVSRNPSKAAPFPVAAFAITSDPEDEKVFDDLLSIENELDSYTISAIEQINNNKYSDSAITLDHI